MAKPCKHTKRTMDEVDLCASCGLTDSEIELQYELAAARAEIERLKDRQEKIVEDFMGGTHDAFCAADCGRLTANGFCRDCMTHGRVNAYDRLKLAEAFLAEKDIEINSLRKQLPTFEEDCDRECRSIMYRAGYALPVRHSPFCKNNRDS